MNYPSRLNCLIERLTKVYLLTCFLISHLYALFPNGRKPPSSPCQDASIRRVGDANVSGNKLPSLPLYLRKLSMRVS